MKIDVGSGGYGYSGPAYYARREADEAEAAENAAASNRLSLSVSRTPLSPSLANALWTIERDRKFAASKTAFAEEADKGPNGGVLNLYLEFEVSSADEFH
ncbi:hypothetical protein NOF55_15425 [Rhizobiaceae bacterium BDR2-2]|uniref:Uncharacterized protein n=1 Tax=Ectorhizobium quercum TaxID=2965071 RepID=A0AAE3N397_9HYPH|nr:hypothetical protein [Ectorhizobium quercum]MCX8998505.1 hypothetical protein [Ectorhizobium quercum]